MVLPTLYQKTATGAIQSWQIEVIHETACCLLVTTHGQVGGKLQSTSDTIWKGKNPGKANETTFAQQAEKEAKAKWTKQVKKGYVESLSDAQAGKVDETVIKGGIEPMLAPSKVYPTFASKLTFPVFVQPKFDGTRLIAVLKGGVCTLWSRTRKQVHSLPHIARAVEAHCGRFGDLILDGEAFSYDYRNSFEDLMSLIRTDKPSEGHEVVDYHVYDLPSYAGDFAARNAELFKMLYNAEKPLIRVETYMADDHETVMRFHEKNLAMEYEGSMVRNDGPYEFGKRSFHLQKLKNFKDAEYLIVDAEEGRGKDAGTVGAFVCRIDPDHTEDQLKGDAPLPEPQFFKARLKATYERRRELFQHPEQWRDQMLTVTYQNLSADGVPRFPIGKGLRSPAGE